MRGTSRSHSSTGARATWGRSMAQCSSVRLRRSATAWLSTSGTPTSVGRLPRCRAPRPSRSAFRTRRSTVGCPRRVARPHLPRPFRRRRRLTGVRLACVEPYRYGMSQGANLVYVRFVAARAAMNGPSATVGMVHADGPAHTGIDPRVELRDRQLPGSASYTRNGECGLWMANMRSQWSLRPVLRIGSKDPACGPARAGKGGVRPGVAVTDDSVLPAGPPRTAAGSCRTPSDWRDFAGRFRTCPAVVTAGLGSSARAVHLSWSTFAAWVWRGRSTVELVVTQW